MASLDITLEPKLALIFNWLVKWLGFGGEHQVIGVNHRDELRKRIKYLVNNPGYTQHPSTGKSASGVHAMCCRFSLDPFQHQSLFAFGAVKLAFILL